MLIYLFKVQLKLERSESSVKTGLEIESSDVTKEEYKGGKLTHETIGNWMRVTCSFTFSKCS